MPQRIARLFLIACLTASATALQAQATTAALPRFDVVSVRPSNMAERGGIEIKADADGKVRLAHLPLVILLMVVFDMKPDRISGIPPAMMREQFDIAGVPPSNHAGTAQNERSTESPLNKQQRLMLQAVLMDRFGLRFHDSSKEGKVLELRTGKGPLTHTSKGHRGLPLVAPVGTGGLMGRNASMDLVASTLSQFLRTPVVNKTGLNGTFDFKYAYDPDDSAASDDTDFSAATVASVRGLGFDLKPATGSIQTVVIDHLQEPTPN